jgi:hypothetical protein
MRIMEKVMTKNKVANNWAFKDWERHNRVMPFLQARHITITELSHEIGELIQVVSPCIWGVPSRCNKRIEEKIATFLGVARDELFRG